MNVAVVGSRGYPDLKAVKEYVKALPEGTTIVSGAAFGVDSAAESVARQRKLKVHSIPADWDGYGKAAGYKRNKEIVNEADRVVCFWDGTSNGTRHDIKLALEAGKPLEVYPARLFKTTFCQYCGFWLDLVERGEWDGQHVTWSGYGRGECCGHKVVDDGLIEWPDD